MPIEAGLRFSIKWVAFYSVYTYISSIIGEYITQFVIVSIESRLDYREVDEVQHTRGSQDADERIESVVGSELVYCKVNNQIRHHK